MTTTSRMEELKALIEIAIRNRRDALAEISVLTQSDPSLHSENILLLAEDAWEYLEDARRLKALLRDLKESIKPACTCNCHS